MINLLPKGYKKELQHFYRMRVLVVILFFLSVFFFIMAIFLLPALLIAGVKENFISERLAAVKESHKDTKDTDVQNVIEEVNRELSILSGGGQSDPTLYEELVYILARRSNGIRILAVSYQLEPDQNGTLDVRGMASDRDTLIDYVALLKKESRFSSVELPITSLAKSEELSFTVIVHFKK